LRERLIFADKKLIGHECEKKSETELTPERVVERVFGGSRGAGWRCHWLDTIAKVWLIGVAFGTHPGPRKGLSLPADC
jgi:hypothetical protein